MTETDPASSFTSSPGKVPELVLGFWIIKVAATTLGEALGDTVTMSMGLGYLLGAAIFGVALVALVWWQIAAARFHPALYWATIIACLILLPQRAGRHPPRDAAA